MAGYLRPRRGKLATATSQNIVLKRGEVFFEVPTGGVGTGAGKIKMGDGTTAYSALPYFLEPTVIDVAASTIAFTEATSTSNSTLLNAIASGAQLKTIIGNVKKLLRNLDSSVTQLNNDLAGKAPTNHTHNYASSSHSHAWSSITSKPSTFTPSSHNHDYLPLSGGSTSGIVYLNGGATVPTDKGIHYGGDGATYPYIYGYSGKLYIKINNTYWVFGETGMTLNGTVKIT